jgi:hypothetical protein
MAFTSQELSRIDAELDALAPARDCVERAWASLAETPLGDLALVDGALEALTAGLDPAAIAEPERPRQERVSEAPAPSEAAPPPPAQASEAVIAEPTEPQPEEVAGDDPIGGDDDDFLNPFADEPAAASADLADAGVEDDDEDDGGESTMVIDMSMLGGLDGDALFDDFVEDSASAPLEVGGFDAKAPALAHRPSSIPPPVPPAARPAQGDERPTDIEDLRGYLEGEEDEPDLELFVDDDAIGAEDGAETSDGLGDETASDGSGDDAQKKKGFFKKLFG